MADIFFHKAEMYLVKDHKLIASHFLGSEQGAITQLITWYKEYAFERSLGTMIDEVIGYSTELELNRIPVNG